MKVQRILNVSISYTCIMRWIKLVLREEIKITQKEGARKNLLDLPHWSNDRIRSHYSGSFLQTERFSYIPPHPHSPWCHRADPQRPRKLWVEQWCLLNSLCLQSLGYTDTDLEIGHKVSFNKLFLPTYALTDEIPETWKNKNKFGEFKSVHIFPPKKKNLGDSGSGGGA